MPHPIRLLFVLHNHQPIGNFDGVFEQAYQDSYRPFLELFESYPELKLALHTSGSLLEWLDAHHPEYVDRLAGLVAAGRVEIVGGAFYEAILPMIPSRDRIGQIRSYRDLVGKPLRHRSARTVDAGAGVGAKPDGRFGRGGRAVHRAGRCHFKASGIGEDQLHGYYITEDDGKLLRVFPGSEQLRYDIPFAAPNDVDRLSARHRRAAIPAPWPCSPTTAKNSAPGPTH